MTEENKKDIKKAISIYKIDTNLINLEDGEDDIIDKVTEKIVASKYSPVACEIKQDFLQEYNKRCYKLTSTNNVSWEDFVNQFTTNKLQLKKMNNSSVILLIESKENHKNVFAICFGSLAFFVLQDIIDKEFGLDILSRIIEPNENILKASKGRKVVGTTQGQLSIYRQLHSLNDIDDFGSIFQELNVTIKKETLEKFGIETEKNFKNCCAKQSFQIKTSISASTIEKFIKGCEYALTQDKQPINSTREIDHKSNAEAYQRIKNGAIHKIWENINDDTEKNMQYDLCHKEFDKYMQADSYKLKYARHSIDIESHQTLKDILPTEIKTEEEFNSFIESAKIVSYKVDGFPETSDSVFKHLFIEHEETISGEVQKYFILNGNIYKLEESFLQSLNDKIKKFKDKGLFYKTNDVKICNKNDYEGTYNKSYIDCENYVVVHPFLINNIEICDFMKIENDDLFLYFVKDKFSATVRDLAYQIYTTAKIIENNKNSNYEDLKNFCKKFKQQTEYSTRTHLDENQLLDLFKTKSIKYVFMFRDESNRSLEKEPHKFNSNIAKFALIDLVHKMNLLDSASILIEQVQTES